MDGIDNLLRALRCLREELHRDDWTCVMLGDGEVRPQLEGLARELGLVDNVRFVGRVKPCGAWCRTCGAMGHRHGAPIRRNEYNDRCTMIKTMEYMAQGVADRGLRPARNPLQRRRTRPGMSIRPTSANSAGRARAVAGRRRAAPPHGRSRSAALPSRCWPGNQAVPKLLAVYERLTGAPVAKLAPGAVDPPAEKRPLASCETHSVHLNRTLACHSPTPVDHPTMSTVTQQPRSAADATTSIDTVETITADEFFHRYIKRNRPLVMTRMMDTWPAKDKWTFRVLQPVESGGRSPSGRTATSCSRTRSTTKPVFRDFLEKLLAEPDGDAGGRRPYLSVFKIFAAFSAASATTSDFTILNRHKRKHTVSGWIGPGRHGDRLPHRLGRQHPGPRCGGRKRLLLVAPDETRFMYRSRKFDQGTTLSQVDADHVDLERFPLYARATPIEVVLHPGQMLFIPRGWWHHVRSLDKSISVSNIAYDLKGILVDAGPFPREANPAQRRPVPSRRVHVPHASRRPPCAPLANRMATTSDTTSY